MVWCAASMLAWNFDYGWLFQLCIPKQPSWCSGCFGMDIWIEKRPCLGNERQNADTRCPTLHCGVVCCLNAGCLFPLWLAVSVLLFCCVLNAKVIFHFRSMVQCVGSTLAGCFDLSWFWNLVCCVWTVKAMFKIGIIFECVASVLAGCFNTG